MQKDMKGTGKFIKSVQTNIKSDVTLVLTGDIMLGSEFLKFKNEKNVGYEYPFRNLKKLFEEANIVFGNFEGTLSKNGPLREKGPNLYSPPESISALKYLNFDIVSLGNNHINDFGTEGIIETMEILRDNKILFFGAGRNLNEANKEVIIEKKGLKICFLGYTTDEKHVKSIIANADTAGCVFYDFKKIKEDIERIKTQSDIICISLHWGHEYYQYPSLEQVELAHQIIDAGAHIVIGHHPHIIQGFERYKHGIIFYSLGNFFFPNYYDKSGYLHKWREESNKSIIAKCQVGNVNNKAKIGEVKILPVFMSEGYQVVILDGKDKEGAILRIEEISKEIKRNDYKDFWENYNKRRSKELSEMNVTIGLSRLLQRIKELGIRGCIRKVSMRNAKGVSRMLVGYLWIKYRNMLGKWQAYENKEKL